MSDARKTRTITPADREPVLLVTGFGAFAQYSDNPSGDVAEAVDQRRIGGVRVVGRRVPVVWREAWEGIRAAAEHHKPDALLCLGVAPESFIRLEVMAKNAARACLDVHGETPPLFEKLRIVEGAPPAYWTTLPVEHLHERLWQRHHLRSQPEVGQSCVVAEPWPDAGWYLCNHVFFHVMHFLGGQIPYRGFIHLPRYPDPAADEAGTHRSEVLAAGIFLVEELARWLAALAGTDAVTGAYPGRHRDAIEPAKE